MRQIDSSLPPSLARRRPFFHLARQPQPQAFSRLGPAGRAGGTPPGGPHPSSPRLWGGLAAALFFIAAAINPAQAQWPVFGVYRELWTGLSDIGDTLDALTNTAYNPNWPDYPDPAYTKVYTNFETEVDTGMNLYGQRLRTFVVPPANGNYVFWISSDDSSELFVSTDETPANKAPTAWVNSWTSSREWTREPNQQGAPLYLEAGRRYYVEAIMQQGSGGDNLAVRWQLPDGTFEEPMHALSQAGTRLIPFDGQDTLPGIYQQTTNLTLVEGLNVTLSVLVTNPSPVAYRWRLQGANLPGLNATQPFYALTNVSIPVNNGQVYSCLVSNAAGAVTSAPIPLTVIRDTVPPTVTSVGNVGSTNVLVVYSKPVEPASATNRANYVFTNALPVSGASLGPDNLTVTLATAPLLYGSNYTLVINSVRDRASIPNTIAHNTTVSFLATLYASRDIGNPSGPSIVTYLGTNGLNVSAAGAAIGGSADQFNFNYQLRVGDFDVAVRVAGLSPSDVWAKAGLMARETLDANGRFAAALTTPTMVGSFFEWRDPAGSSANVTGNFPANYPNTWLRLKRAGSTFTGFVSYDGQTWMQLGSAAIAMPSQVYFGFALSSHSPAQPSLVEFRDLAPVTNAVVAAPSNPHEPLGPCSRRTPLVISEIMYKPAPRTDLNNLEFIELYNTNPWWQDLSGYQLLADNLSYTFPPGTLIGGGAFLVIAASPQSIQNVYAITNVLGPYAGSLKKAGTIQLLDGQGAVLLTVPYSNLYPWPVAADGTGHSIVLANPTYGEGDPRAWDVSDVVGGSPGQMEAFRPSPLRNVVINELLAHSENPAVLQFVELYNHSNQTNDLSGCILTDDPDTNKFLIPAGTLIPPRGFVAFDQTQLGFLFNGAGGTVYFIKPDRTRILDALQFESQADGLPFGRSPDGAKAFYPLTAPTPGTNNSALWMGDIVINELMYDPITGNDDDQYIELYNKGAHTVSLANWQFTAGVKFAFPPGATLAPNGYLVVGRNLTNLLAKYPTNLNAGNTVGDFGGALAHRGERVALAMPQLLTVTNTQGRTTNIIYVVQDEVTYEAGGRWGQWAHGGGSSLELINPNSNHRLAYNWADSDETMKSAWTNLEFTGVLDNGYNYGPVIDYAQVGLLDVGECLVDNIEVRPGGPTGPNIVANSTFETGLSNWSPQGDHMRSGIEPASGLGGYQSSQSLHLRSSDSVWTLADYVQGALSQTTLAEGQTNTLRLKARWLRGWPEVLLRLRGNWLEVTGRMPVPANLGTPGLRNSRYVANPGPAIYEVKHSPPLPATNQPVVVTARFHDLNGFQPTLLYRIDTNANPAPSYTTVAMLDNGTNGDAVAGDGLFSATIPAQPAGTVVAFLVQARDTLGATNLFPANLKNNAGVPRECVVAFGDPIPTGSFSHHHVFITQNWAQRWEQGGGVSHEYHDGTWVDGGGRIIYNWSGRYAGSPYHQYLGSPVTTVGGMHWVVPWDDALLGVASLNKQHVPGNGALDDDTLQREQTSFWMAQQIGLPGENRRYYVYYVNGVRHGPLMEDAQTPDGDMLKEFFPNDTGGVLFKNHSWFEGDVAVDPNNDYYMNFSMPSWCVLGRFTTTINGLPNQYKLARYRWMWWIRQYPDSANDFTAVFDLIDAANLPTNSPAYYAQMEAQVDTEAWLRMSAIEHATGDWDSLFTQNQWNMYMYKPTRGKWTPLKWDWNITLGGGTTTWPSDGSQLFNVGAYDPVMATFHYFPAYKRAYLRALQDIANLAMNNALVDPLLDVKYAAFVANGLTSTPYSGLTVRDPAASLKSWIATMHNSLLTALTNQAVTNVPFAVNSVTVNNNVATLSGTAPLAAKTVWVNGIQCPLTWPSVTNWAATVPLQPGSNVLNVVAVDLHGQPLPGATATALTVFNGTLPSPAGLVVINEIMYHPLVPNTEYVELYNRSPNVAFDLSGWQLQGLDYTFPAGSMLAPNSYLVLAADRVAYATTYGPTNLVFDTFDPTLPIAGQILSLVRPGPDPASSLFVAQLRCGSAPPWPAAANGLGASLQLIDARQDNWRTANWAAVQTNAISPPHWVHVSSTTPMPVTSSTFFVYLESAGDIYIDDLQLLDADGNNRLADGDFESPLASAWNLTANFAQSTLSTTVKHAGNASLHLVATAAGSDSDNAIYQDIQPPLSLGQYCTLSFWYLQSTNGGPLVLGLASSATTVSINPAPAITKLAHATPGTFNSVADTLPPFPPLWLNELQADNLTGITNAAGQHAPWLELYNPTANVVPLNGLYLANNYSNLTQWAFPAAASISPGQFKVIFADGQTNLSTSSELHASFSLPSRSGSLALSQLYNGLPQVLDYVDYTNIGLDHSYGSYPDGQSFYRQEFFNPSPATTNLGVGAGTLSFIAYTTPGSVYAQDFNSLPNPGLASVSSANPVTINGITYSLPNPFDFALPPAPSGQNGGLGLPALSGWFGLADPTASVGTRFGASYGDQTTGGQISFGLPNSTNRALGLLATTTTGFTAFGARFINASTSLLDHINLQFTGQVWRQSDRPKTLTFYYLVDPSGARTFPTDYTALLPSLDVAFPTVAADAGGVAVDGTSPLNQTNLSLVNQVITNWPPGAALWLVWEMADPTGKAQGLAIDDLSFSASVAAPNPAPQLGGLSLSGGNLTFSWPSLQGRLYRLQYKDALDAPTWTSLSPDLVGTGSPLPATVPLSGNPQRFYRVLLIP